MSSRRESSRMVLSLRFEIVVRTTLPPSSDCLRAESTTPARSVRTSSGPGTSLRRVPPWSRRRSSIHLVTILIQVTSPSLGRQIQSPRPSSKIGPINSELLGTRRTLLPGTRRRCDGIMTAPVSATGGARAIYHRPRHPKHHSDRGERDAPGPLVRRAASHNSGPLASSCAFRAPVFFGPCSGDTPRRSMEMGGCRCAARSANLTIQPA
jgi:hypothetical protein